MATVTIEAHSVGDRLRLWLFTHRVGQRAVARATGLSNSTISRIMNNLDARPAALRAVAEHIGMTPQEFWEALKETTP